MKIVQMIPADGWRALHYDTDDDEVYAVDLIAFALVEYDELDEQGPPIRAVGLYDLDPVLEGGFTFTDGDSTFVELAPPGTASLPGGEVESGEELEGRVRRLAQKRACRRPLERDDPDAPVAADQPREPQPVGAR